MSAQTSLTRPRDAALGRTLAEIDRLGLRDALLDLETLGYTVIPGVLSPDTVERAKAAILRRVETKTGRKIDPQAASAEDFRGMQYVPYLLYDDPVFAEILLEQRPLALMSYLLGESCVLSSLGCHFRGPGGAPLGLHSDNGAGMPQPFSPISMVANVNYALTPYSREAGALAMVPGSHRLMRQPTAAEGFVAPGLSGAEIAARAAQAGGLDDLEWRDPPGAVSMDIAPGDAVVWHGNTWHGGFVRRLPGVRINLSAYFCRPFVATQERRGDPPEAELLARHDNNPRLDVLLGGRQSYGWRADDWEDLYGRKAKLQPRGLYD
jgi:hypothetical protein